MKIRAMRHAAAALGIASMFAAAPAVADYKTCMELCMKEDGFSHCHAICSGIPTTGEMSTTGDNGRADCSTSDSARESLSDIEAAVSAHYHPKCWERNRKLIAEKRRNTAEQIVCLFQTWSPTLPEVWEGELFPGEFSFLIWKSPPRGSPPPPMRSCRIQFQFADDCTVTDLEGIPLTRGRAVETIECDYR